MRETPMFTSALTTQCLTGRANGGEMMIGGRMLARLSVPKAQHHTLQCVPPGCTVPSPDRPRHPPRTLSSAVCRAGHLPAAAARRKQGHAQLWETRPHSSGVPCRAGRDDIHKNLLFICRRAFLFPLPFHNPHLSLPTSDSSPTCTPKEEAMIMAELDNITSLMPRKPLVCLLRAVSG